MNNYFENIRTVGANLDDGTAKLQEIWKMPHLLLHKNNIDDQVAAKKLVEELRNELRHLKHTVEEHKAELSLIKESHNTLIENATRAVKTLKQDVDDIATLFVEHGYVEPSMKSLYETDLSNLSDQLEMLSVTNNNSSLKDSKTENIEDISMCEEASFMDSRNISNNSIHIETPQSLHKKSPLSQVQMEPNIKSHIL